MKKYINITFYNILFLFILSNNVYANDLESVVENHVESSKTGHKDFFDNWSFSLKKDYSDRMIYAVKKDAKVLKEFQTILKKENIDPEILKSRHISYANELKIMHLAYNYLFDIKLKEKVKYQNFTFDFPEENYSLDKSKYKAEVKIEDRHEETIKEVYLQIRNGKWMIIKSSFVK